MSRQAVDDSRPKTITIIASILKNDEWFFFIISMISAGRLTFIKAQNDKICCSIESLVVVASGWIPPS